MDFRAGDRPLIPCIVSDLSDFRLYRGAQMGILHREDAAGQQICAHLSLKEADGANPQSGRLLTQETSSLPSRARDAAAIGGAREGMPRQSRIFRIASGGLIAARILMRPEQLGHSRTSTEKTRCKSSAHE